MLSDKILHECVNKLLAEGGAPKQEDLECLAKLMSTVGQQLDANPKAETYMQTYFQQVAILSKDMRLDSRTRFALKASMCSCCMQAASIATEWCAVTRVPT